MPEQPAIKRQFTLSAVAALVTLYAIALTFVRALGPSAWPMALTAMGYPTIVFLTAHLGRQVTYWSALTAAACWGVSISLIAPRLAEALLLGSMVGFGFGGVLGFATEIGAYVLLLPKFFTPRISNDDFEDAQLANKRRVASWIIALLWLACWYYVFDELPTDLR
jgi:hypothetical protein